MTRTSVFLYLGACTAVFIYFGLPWLYGKLQTMLLKRKSISTGTIVLTFDDGPGSRLTPLVLNMLSEYNVKATFFLLGRNIVGHEHLVRRIAAGGHEICSHGYDHLNYWKTWPVRALVDINEGWKAIDNVLGFRGGTYPFRPPYGKINFLCLMYLLVRRVKIVYWTVDSGDTSVPNDKRDSRRAALLAKESGGAVVLAHDFDRSDDSSIAFVLDSLRRILVMAKKRDMRIGTVSQLLSCVR